MKKRDGGVQIARRLHKRGTWPTFEDCMKEVDWWTINADFSKKEMDAKVDNGELDPPGKTNENMDHRILRGGTLIYKCRRCGAEEDSVHCPSIVKTFAQLNASGRSKDDSGSPGMVVYMYGLHCCPGGRVGILDLIGFDPDEKKQ